MRFASFITAVFMLLGTTHIVLPCVCSAEMPAAEMKADHSCCAGVDGDGQTETESPDAQLTNRCLDGCGQTLHIGTVAQSGTPDALSVPVEHPPVAPVAAAPWVPEALAPILAYSASRGPPPDPVATRLARLQTWRC